MPPSCWAMLPLRFCGSCQCEDQQRVGEPGRGRRGGGGVGKSRVWGDRTKAEVLFVAPSPITYRLNKTNRASKTLKVPLI